MPSELQTAIDSTLKPASAALGDAEAELHVVNIAAQARSFHTTSSEWWKAATARSQAETMLFSAHYDHDGLAADGGDLSWRGR